MVETFTGFLTSENMTASAGNVTAQPSQAAIAIIFLLLAWIFILFLAYVVLAIISCVRHKIPLADLIKRSFNSFMALWRPMFKYYIPQIILSFIIGVFLVIFYIMNIFANITSGGGAAMILLLIAFMPFLIASLIYFGLLDSSLAKSYYTSLKTKKFVFRWLSFGEFIKLILLGLIYFLISIAGLILLGIPLLFLPAISLFLRFPLLNEGKSIGGTIRKLISMLRKDFWNLFFFYFIFSLLTGFASSFIQNIPLVGYIAVMVMVRPFSTLLSAEAYNHLNKSYEGKGKKPRAR